MKKIITVLQFVLLLLLTGAININAQDKNVKPGNENTNGTEQFIFCDLSGMVSFTQGGWGSKPSGGNPGTIREAHFDDVFPNGMIISGGGFTLTFTSSNAIQNFLPSGGTPKAMTQDLTDPTKGKDAGGVLGAQVVAATINVMFDAEGKIGTGQYAYGDLLFTDGPFQGMSVGDFLTLAQTALTGGSTQGHSYSEISDAATKINENFDNGTVNKGDFTCPASVTASLGDKVWLDVDEDGVQDNGEAGVSGVTVNLYQNGNMLETTTTNRYGIYLFEDLDAGTYQVEFILPNGYSFTGNNEGSNESYDSDANTSTGRTDNIALNGGDFLTDIDAGLVTQKASLGNYVWLDNDQDGVQDGSEEGILGVTVKLFNDQNNELASTTTDQNGLYSFTNLEPGSYYITFEVLNGYAFSPANSGNDFIDSDADVSTGKTAVVTLAGGENNTSLDAGMYDTRVTVGNYVWSDLDKDGIQDNNEQGLSGVEVQLYNCNDNLVASTTTDQNGNYLFEQLLPGDYYVKFTLPAGYVFSAADNGADDELDSDADLNTGKTPCTTLSTGDINLSLDAGMYQPKSKIGNFVWHDQDEDGIQDNSEPALGNIPVTLYDCNGNFVASTHTDEHGAYLFDGLDAGDYKVVFTKPSGYFFTTQNAGSDSELDSDADPVTGATSCITLGVNEENNSVDAGFYQPSGSIGDFVWYDVNENGIQDNGEEGVQGLSVKLYDCNDNLLESGLTNPEGYYKFTNYPAGDYYVKFSIPNGYEFTTANVGSNDEADSDVDPATGKTLCFALGSAEEDLSRDAGIFLTPTTTDIEVSKTVDVSNPDNGDNVTFTVTAKNNGSLNATDVVVKDYLPAGLTFVSANASKGDYDENNGNWEVGDLANGATETLTITAKIELGANPAFSLHEAEGYNLFLFGDLIQPSSDTEGKVAVGGNAYLSNYSVGALLQPSGGLADVLLVGGHLQYESGSIEAGNVVYGASSNLPKTTVSITDGTLRQDSVIDFSTAESNLKSLSANLSGYTANGTTNQQWSAINLTGTNPIINVFDVSGADLTAANELNISVPNGSVVVVNVSGDNISWSGGLVVSGTAITNTIYNFYEATSLHIISIDVLGSVLAPYADLDFPSGVINGQVIAKSMHGIGQFNNKLFAGNIPAGETIVNCAELIQSLPMDNNNTNNSACVTVVVGDTSSSGTGGTAEYEWEMSGVTGIEEMIWSLDNDANLNMLCGTVGGNIYRSEDNGVNWVLLNGSMNVGWIWDIKTDQNGKIYAATESGIYSSNDNGATWNGPVMPDLDVRSLAIDNFGNLYAGTWGEGVYVSSNGNTWTAANSGLGNLAVHAIVVSSNSVIYAGTYGGGVYKSVDLGANWEATGKTFDYVWSLGITSNDILFAGTYGGGVYASDNGGDSWQLLGGTSNYVYSVTVDAADNVFVATWNNGVYMLNLNGPGSNGPAKLTNTGSFGWLNIGLTNEGVSSIAINELSTELIAGSEDGEFYKLKLNSVTDIEEVETNLIPEEFALGQNYPNPFNPSTTIKVDIKEDGNYKINIYNILGERVTTLFNGYYSAGSYKISFVPDGLASGLYLYQLTGDKVNIVKKMVYLK